MVSTSMPVESTVYFNDPLTTQVGGAHYKDFKIQPAEFITKNGLSFLQGSVIKRICPYRTAGKGLEDLKKIKHEIDLIIKLEGWEDETHAGTDKEP